MHNFTFIKFYLIHKIKYNEMGCRRIAYTIVSEGHEGRKEFERRKCR